MAIAIFPKRFTVKPPIGIQINWAHSLSKDLAFLALFNEGGGSVAKDSVRQKDFALSAATRSNIGNVGPCAVFNGTSASGNTPTIDLSSSAVITIVLWMLPDVTNNSDANL